ncbi:MAG: hypothetical protein PHQ23_14250 [Candidatus Wallbacteria bacterium]|nr:hypothetical protein [Candidatus Wallbacteria bacterium]
MKKDFLNTVPLPGTDLNLRLEEDHLFAGNLPAILENADAIRNDPDFYFCTFGSAFVSSPQQQPEGMIPLGALLDLWEDDLLIDGCLQCGSDVFIIGSSASPGIGNAWGYCGTCGVYNSYPGCLDHISLLHSALARISRTHTGRWKNASVFPTRRTPSLNEVLLFLGIRSGN